MSEIEAIKTRVGESVAGNEETRVVFNVDKGILMINDQPYEAGRLSFSEVAGIVLGSLKETYGEYETIPYTFNSEAYENDGFRAEVLALGGQGLLEFKVYRKKASCG